MKKEQERALLVTCALPYANGQLHLGHMVEAIQADIWVRYHKLLKNHCLFICGSDAHGTAIMLSAQKNGISPEAWLAQIGADHKRDYDTFSVGFDEFYTTHSEENRQCAEAIYHKLKARGDIKTRVITQAFDEEKQLFLSDRYIKGTCPRCKAPDQYGDNCEVCGATYGANELLDARSVLSGAKPIQKESEHYFFELEHYRDLLTSWIEDGHLQPQVANKLKEWFGESFKAWDISRDAPYFGFEIPDHPGKYFYVWLDAPIGYISSTKHFCDKNNLDYQRYWQQDSDAELVHFIGKDIVYFHALFWPAMLQGSEHRLPNKVQVHGYLTVNGEKMSKSRGTFITAKHFSDHINPEMCRYYFAAKLNAQVEDIDFNLDDFMARVNSDLVGKFVNLASRCAGFISKKFEGQLAAALPEPALYDEFVAAASNIEHLYETLNFNRCMREIMALADRANQYIDQQKPWVLAKEQGKEQQVQAVCTQGLNLFRVLATYLQPVLPKTMLKVEAFFNQAIDWHCLEQPLLNHQINRFKPLLQRVTTEDLDKLTQTVA